MAENLLPLETWRELFAFHPYHFWQQADNFLVPVTSACNTIVREHAWQAPNFAGREEIRNAIGLAEDRLRNLLNYSTSPHYVTETLQFPTYPNERLEKRGYAGGDARWMTVKLSEGKIIGVGSEGNDLIAVSAVVYSDTDGDGLNDTFTATAATTVTDTDEISVYFSTLDRFSESISNKWVISPVRVSISAGTVTVKGSSWLLAKPVLYRGVAKNEIDPTVAANFVTSIDIYHHRPVQGITTTDCEATLVWESRPMPYWMSNVHVGSNDPGATGTAIARLNIRNAELGIVALGEAVYNTTTGTWCPVDSWYWHWGDYPPDRVIVRYYAGSQETKWQQIVSRLAAAELSRSICACQDANRELYNWQFDLARSSGNNDEQFGYVSQEDLVNPLGTRRGHLFAWKELKFNMQLTGYAP